MVHFRDGVRTRVYLQVQELVIGTVPPLLTTLLGYWVEGGPLLTNTTHRCKCALAQCVFLLLEMGQAQCEVMVRGLT